MSKIIWVASITYLAAEFWFNAHLLTALSSNFTVSDINNIEAIGRLISGVGISILLIKSVFPAFGVLSKNTKYFILLLCIATGFLTANIIQQEITSNLQNTSTASERKAAFSIAMVMPSILNGSVVVHGFDLSPDEYKTPQGMTYIALLPAFAISSNNADKKFAEVAKSVTIGMLDDAVNNKIDEYWRSYVQINNQLISTYNNQYIPASELYLKKSSEMNGLDAESLWDQYLTEMDKKGISIDSRQPAFVKNAVLKKLSERGLKMPDSWELNNKEQFISAVNAKKNHLNFSQLASKRIGKKIVIEPNLNFYDFVNNPYIQADLRLKTGLKSNFKANMSRDEFNRTTATNIKPELISKAKIPLNDDVSTFADGGKNEQVGKTSIARVKGPMISLKISLISTIANFISLLFSLSKSMQSVSFLSSAKIKISIATLILSVAVIFLPLTMNNNISNSKAFRNVLANEKEPSLSELRWITNVQPVIYPIGNAVSKIFQG